MCGKWRSERQAFEDVLTGQVHSTLNDTEPTRQHRPSTATALQAARFVIRAVIDWLREGLSAEWSLTVIYTVHSGSTSRMAAAQ